MQERQRQPGKNRRLNIAFLSGGSSDYYDGFCELLAERLDLTVFYERHSLKGRDMSWSDIKGNSYQSVWLEGVNVGDEMAFCPGIIRYLKKNRFDLVVLHDYLSPTGMLASLYMRAFRIPFAIHADGGVKKETEKLCIRFLKRFFVSGACAYFSSGRITDEYFTFYGADIRNIYRYPFTSVHERDIRQKPLPESERRRLRSELGLEKRLCDAVLVLYVGSIIRRKGVDLLLRCARRVGERAEFLIIGGEPTDKMKQWIRRHGITNVTFRGFEPPERVRQYMRCADLFVFPTRYDIWGLVVNEAMAAGLPVITTDQCVSGVELVENGRNGLLVHAGDVDALTMAVRDMVSLPEAERQRMCTCSLEKIKAYSLEEMARVYKERLCEICEMSVWKNL